MNKILRHIILGFAFWGVGIVSIALAQEGNASLSVSPSTASYEENLRRWQSMSEEQREAIRQKVYAMGVQQRRAIIDNARRFKRFSREDQYRIWKNYQRFQRLSNEQREILIKNVRNFQRLPPPERAQLRRELRAQRGYREDVRYRQDDFRQRMKEAADRREELRARREAIENRRPEPEHRPVINRQDNLRPQESLGKIQLNRPSTPQGFNKEPVKQRVPLSNNPQAENFNDTNRER